jgi:hypothetical protein
MLAHSLQEVLDDFQINGNTRRLARHPHLTRPYQQWPSEIQHSKIVIEIV